MAVPQSLEPDTRVSVTQGWKVPPGLLTVQRRGGVRSGLADPGLAPASTALLQPWGPGLCWPRGGRSQFQSQEQEGRGSAAEARMTVLPASGKEGQQRQTTARQEGCTLCRVACGGWAVTGASEHSSRQAQMGPDAE